MVTTHCVRGTDTRGTDTSGMRNPAIIGRPRSGRLGPENGETEVNCQNQIKPEAPERLPPQRE